jgi:hypothetical protein
MHFSFQTFDGIAPVEGDGSSIANSPTALTSHTSSSARPTC